LTVVSLRRAAEASSTITLSAGARSHDTNDATVSTPAASQATPFKPRNSNHSFRLDA
jgi:hypothetical protein